MAPRVWVLNIKFGPQCCHLLRILFFRQRLAGVFLQAQLFRCRQFFALEHPRADLAVVLGKDRKGRRFGVVRQEEPVGVTPGVVDRRVAPIVVGLGTRRVTGLAVGGAGIGQAVVAGSAQLQHLVHGGQVLALPDGALGAGHYFHRRESRQRLQPQSLGVVQCLGIREGRVELVVVAELEQAEDFVQRALLFVQRVLALAATSLCP